MKMASVTQLEAPAYTEEEQQALIDFVLAQKKSCIQEFMEQAELPKSGTKPELRDRLQNALYEGRLTYEQIVDFLDSVVPWGKQHVFLFNGPPGDQQAWKSPNYMLQHLKRHRVGHMGNFYWLANTNGNPAPNPLKGDVHVVIVGDKSRINFPTPNNEDVVRYVLHRVRELS